MKLTVPEGFILSEIKDIGDGLATFSVSKDGHEQHCVYTKGKVSQKTLNAYIQSEIVRELEKLTTRPN